jgi:hypothetical protein
MIGAQLLEGPHCAALALALALMAAMPSSAAELKNPMPPVVIRTSAALPVVGQTVRVEIAPEVFASDRPLYATGPAGRTTLRFNENAVAEWTPSHYGRHVLKYGTHKRTIWVTSRPLHFNWWTTKTYPEFITSGMVERGQDPQYWKQRGVTQLRWIGGAYLIEEKHQNPPFSRPEQWLETWLNAVGSRLYEPQEGICLDEIYANGERADGIAIPQAVEELRKRAAKDFFLGIYYSGIEENFYDGMWHLRESDCVHLQECYWGDESIYSKRWQDITLYRLQDRAVLVIAPGFNQSKRVSGSHTAEELVAEFAMLRRVAPDAAGFGIFNAYDRPDLETLADKLIEDYFLKPVVHLQLRQGKLEARNIGQEDAAGYSLCFLDAAGKELNPVRLETLRPEAGQTLDIPSPAAGVRVNVPDGAVNIYPNGGYELPKDRDLVQVIHSSVAEGAVLPCPPEGFTFSAIFSKGLAGDCINPDSVFLHGLQSGNHTGVLTYDNETRTLIARFGSLPLDRYTLRLLSGEEGFRSEDGLPLDGSGNGLADKPSDHFAVHFRLE